MKLVSLLLAVSVCLGCASAADEPRLGTTNQGLDTPPPTTLAISAGPWMNTAAACGWNKLRCQTVTVQNLTERPIASTWLQAVSISPDVLNQHSATNYTSDNPWGLSDQPGLWQLTETGAIPGVIGAGGTAQLLLTFADDDGKAITATYRTLAMMSYTVRTADYGGGGYVDACALEGSTDLGQSSHAVTLPFDWTLYGGTYGEATLSAGGISFGGGSLAGGPSVLAWYDTLGHLAYGAGGHACAATTGSAPGRATTFTWKGLTLTDDPGSSIDLSVTLVEGDELDLGLGAETVSDPSRGLLGPVREDGNQDAVTADTYAVGDQATFPGWE